MWTLSLLEIYYLYVQLHKVIIFQELLFSERILRMSQPSLLIQQKVITKKTLFTTNLMIYDVKGEIYFLTKISSPVSTDMSLKLLI